MADSTGRHTGESDTVALLATEYSHSIKTMHIATMEVEQQSSSQEGESAMIGVGVRGAVGVGVGSTTGPGIAD